MPKPLKNWKEALDGIEYDPTAGEITTHGYAAVVELGVGGQLIFTLSTPDESRRSGEVVHISDEAMYPFMKLRVFKMAKRLTVEAAYPFVPEDTRVRRALLSHVRAKFFNGATSDSVERADVEFVLTMLPQVKAKVEVIPGLIAGILEDRDWHRRSVCEGESAGLGLIETELRFGGNDEEEGQTPSVDPIDVKFDLDPDDLAILRSVFTDEGEPLPIVRPRPLLP